MPSPIHSMRKLRIRKTFAGETCASGFVLSESVSVILCLCNARWHEPGAQHAENACGNGHFPEVIQADLRRHERIGKRQLRGGQERQRETGKGDKFKASTCEALEEWDQAHDPENPRAY